MKGELYSIKLIQNLRVFVCLCKEVFQPATTECMRDGRSSLVAIIHYTFAYRLYCIVAKLPRRRSTGPSQHLLQRNNQYLSFRNEVLRLRNLETILCKYNLTFKTIPTKFSCIS